MHDFDEYTTQELEVLDGIAEGQPVSNFDLDVVKSLVQKQALEDFQGSLIVPILVMHRWEQYKKETGFRSH